MNKRNFLKTLLLLGVSFIFPVPVVRPETLYVKSAKELGCHGIGICETEYSHELIINSAGKVGIGNGHNANFKLEK